jgi:hypothetical protein
MKGESAEKKNYVDCAIIKGEYLSVDALFLVLIFEQHKMINEFIAKLARLDRM